MVLAQRIITWQKTSLKLSEIYRRESNVNYGTKAAPKRVYNDGYRTNWKKESVKECQKQDWKPSNPEMQSSTLRCILKGKGSSTTVVCPWWESSDILRYIIFPSSQIEPRAADGAICKGHLCRKCAYEHWSSSSSSEGKMTIMYLSSVPFLCSSKEEFCLFTWNCNPNGVHLAVQSYKVNLFTFNSIHLHWTTKIKAFLLKMDASICDDRMQVTADCNQVLHDC